VADSLSDTARLIALSAAEIADRQVCFVGIGIPSLVAMAAKQSHAPDAVLVYESGAIDSLPPIPPLSTGSPAVVANTAMVTSCLGVFSMLQRGLCDLGLLSAAQVDRFGNLNSTVLGPYAKPKVRLVGSGGAHDIALLAKEIIIMMPRDPRRFVPRVDFITSPGLPNDREPGRPSRGRGPRCLITPRARFTFENGELTLDAVAAGFGPAEAVEGIAWTVPQSPRLRSLPPPDPVLLDIAIRLEGMSSRNPS
jgi:glutaconate CoA-transferase subunit B